MKRRVQLNSAQRIPSSTSSQGGKQARGLLFIENEALRRA